MIRSLCLLLLLWGWEAGAEDAARENELVEELRQREERELILLDAGGSRFAALYRPSIRSPPQGGAVLVQDGAVPPDAGLLQPLRLALALRGWSTVAIQAPVPEPGATEPQRLALLPQTLVRIDAGLRHLQAQPAQPAVLVGLGSGTLAVAQWLGDRPEPPIAAAVLVGVPDSPSLEAVVSAVLGKNRKPLLEVVANRAAAPTPEPALQRKRLQGENPRYRQVVVADPGSDYREIQDTLGNLIHGWLSRTLADATAAKPPQPSSESAPPQPPGQPPASPPPATPQAPAGPAPAR